MCLSPVANASQSEAVGPGLVEPLRGHRSGCSVALLRTPNFWIDETEYGSARGQFEKSRTLNLSFHAWAKYAKNSVVTSGPQGGSVIAATLALVCPV